MGYKISKGILETELAAWLKQAAENFRTFADGRVDYGKADIAPIVMCVVAHGDKILLLKRGYGLADAEGYWSVVTGFIDEPKPVIEQVRQEVSEELGLQIEDRNVRIGKSYTIKNSKEKRSYIVFPVLIKFNIRPKIILDHEHTDYAWIKRAELENYEILDDLPYAIDYVLRML